MEWLIASAQAQAAGGAQPNALLQMLPLLLIFVVFYFLLIRPQAKRRRSTRPWWPRWRR
jgi:preprotein translocase subunit YajC